MQKPRRNRRADATAKTSFPNFFTIKVTALLAALFAGVTMAIPDPVPTNGLPELTTEISGQQLLLELRGQTNQIYNIEASTNLADWQIIAQRAGGAGPVTVTDPQAGRYPQRYYRAVPQAGAAPVSSLTAMGQDNFAADKILVKPLPGADLSSVNLTLSVQVLSVFSAFNNLTVIKVPTGMTPSTLIAEYQRSGLVQYAEPDYYLHVLATPDDYYYTNGALWDLHNYGQIGGKTNADIDAPDAWSLQHDATNIIVAVVDTGVRYTHEDLASNMWVNPADGSHGTNVVAGNNDPNDDYGHGTHVAGTIGAVGNNIHGVVGVAWHVKIMACKFLDSSGNGTIDGAIACLNYARTHGANIVNASWGAPSFTSQSLHDAIAALGNAGILFVAAAGNSGGDNDTTPVYPASYSDLPNVIAVAATDPSDSLASFSDYGLTNVDLGAPGTSIISCWNGSDSDYQYDDGTSMAAAVVSGAAAVLEAHYPGESYQQIKQRMLLNVDPQPSLQGRTISGGRLNLYKALTGSSAPPPVTASFTASPASGLAPLTVQFTDQSSGPVVSWNWNFGDGSTSTSQNPSHTYTSAGSYTAKLTVTGSSGQTGSTNQTITATNTPTVTASFAASPNSGAAPLTVQFTDQSSGPIASWKWNFGDGSTSSSQNPSHIYTNAGSYTAKLTVTGSSGQTNSASHTITVTNAPSVTASFAASPNSGAAPLTVQFTDQSSGPVVSWNWSFGDGSSSTSQNPSHTYSNAGSYTAKLTVTGSSGQTGSTSQTITVTNTPTVTASFAASPNSGAAPLTVQFTDQSSGPVVSWNWSFGDGSSSSSQNPSHTYAGAGSYTAKLTVTGSSGQTGSTSHAITVTNLPSVTASFSANPTAGLAPLTVKFTDQSSGPVVSWNWNFGDGSTSTSQNPSHTYTSAGNYTANLTVTGSSGQSDSTSHTITATNLPPVTASFAANPASGQTPLAVQFTDQSTGPVVSWNWNFGDGASSAVQNPTHTYYSVGNFTATLTVTGSSGQTNTTSHIIAATNAPPPATVTVVASQPLATSLTPGVFELTRTGDTSSQLTVNYSLGGTAQNGVDYQTLSGSVVFPAGSPRASVVVQPLGLLNLLKTVVLTISPNSNYTVGSPDSATVSIVASLQL